MLNVVLLLPTYNEKENLTTLTPLLEEQIFPKIKNYQMHILIVDDNSPDGTAKEIKNLMKKYKNLHLSLGEKKGLGAAYFRGIDYAINHMQADLIITMDADGQHDPAIIPHLINTIEDGYDFVIGSRYIQGGKTPKQWNLHRKLLSNGANFFTGYLLREPQIHDWTNSYRAIKKEIFLHQKDKIKQYKNNIFLIAFLYEAQIANYKIKEIPIHLTQRIKGKSKLQTKSYIMDLLRFVITHSINIHLR